MSSVAAHALVQTVLCKVDGCEEDAEDRRGRFAGLCVPHKRDAVAEMRATAAGRPKRAPGELAARAGDVAKAARKLERADAAADAARAEFRLVWLQLGAAAGVLLRRPV